MCLFSCDSSTTSESKSLQDCLVGYDWCNPNCNNPKMAWKFSSEATFNYSTTLFGGMSAWGTWRGIGSNKIEITYTKNLTGDVLPKRILIMPDCRSLSVGATLYRR